MAMFIQQRINPSAGYPNCQRCYRLVDDLAAVVNSTTGRLNIVFCQKKPILTPVLTIGQGSALSTKKGSHKDVIHSENSYVMKGVLWGWLLVLGAIFWASMLGLDSFYLPFITHDSTLPEDVVVPIEETLAQNYLSKYAYQMLTLTAVFGIAFYINRRFFKKSETNIVNVEQITQDQEMDNASNSLTCEDQRNKNTLEVNDDNSLNINNDEQEENMQESYITPPSVDVRELQARLKEFEDNLAMLKQKGERLVNHTEMQKKRWEELNAGDQ